MGFRLQRRIGLGNGLGLNLSRSGFSLSQRTSWGTFGTRGFSIRTGIPGLSFRSGRRGGGLSALLVGLVTISVYAVVAMAYAGAVLLWWSLVASYWMLVFTVQAGRWIALTLYDLGVYAATRRLPPGDPRPSLAPADPVPGIAAPLPSPAPARASTVSWPTMEAEPPADFAAMRASAPQWAAPADDDFRRLRDKLDQARGPAGRRAVVERALRVLPASQHETFMLEASTVEVEAALAKVQGLKSASARRRVLAEALAQLRDDRVPDELQSTQIGWLEDALRALER